MHNAQGSERSGASGLQQPSAARFGPFRLRSGVFGASPRQTVNDRRIALTRRRRQQQCDKQAQQQQQQRHQAVKTEDIGGHYADKEQSQLTTADEFKLLELEVRRDACGVALKHQPMNRSDQVLPYDHNRVCLEPSPETPLSGYINASCVALPHERFYYVTQAPLPVS